MAGCPPGSNGHLTALRVTATSPPALTVAWCGAPAMGSVTVSMTDPRGANAVIWIVNSDDRLYSVDGENGHTILRVTLDPPMPGISKWQPAIIAKGRIFFAGNDRVYMLRPQ